MGSLERLAVWKSGWFGRAGGLEKWAVWKDGQFGKMGGLKAGSQSQVDGGLWQK